MELMRFTPSLVLIAALVLGSACELDNTIDIELPKGEAFPIVEACLVEGESYQLFLSLSNTLQDPVRINPLWNEKVFIISGQDSMKLLNMIRVDPDNDYLYNYLLDTLVSGEAEQFTLHIESDSYGTINGSCQPVGDVKIEYLELDKSGALELGTVNLEDPAGNYYQLRCLEYDSGELSRIHQQEFDLHGLSAGPVSITNFLELSPFDSMRIDLYRIDSTAYEYYHQVSNALNANIDPFTPPTPFPGNVTNAWGIFSFATRDSRTLHTGSQ